jgi:hypothetical protein
VLRGESFDRRVPTGWCYGLMVTRQEL